MSKPSRKLSLKKETLRSLDAQQLRQVNGGLYLIDYVALRQPSKPTTNPTGTDTFAAFNFYDYYYFY